jgi:asparagine synthase (glutamine-hydrolysing)
VSCRLRSAFPIGSHLSGGLDSSAVAVIACRLLRQQGRELTAGFSWSPPPPLDEPVDDERKLIEGLCAREAIRCHYTTLTLQDGVESYARDFTTEPWVDVIKEVQVQRQAAREHVRVLLSGWGGDEGITAKGHGYLAKLWRRGHWRTLHRELTLQSQHAGASRLRRLKHYGGLVYGRVCWPSVPTPVLALLQPYVASGTLPVSFIRPAFAQRYRDAVAGLRGPSLRCGLTLGGGWEAMTFQNVAHGLVTHDASQVS